MSIVVSNIIKKKTVRSVHKLRVYFVEVTLLTVMSYIYEINEKLLKSSLSINIMTTCIFT